MLYDYLHNLEDQAPEMRAARRKARLPSPTIPHAPDELKAIMAECWSAEPADRPTMATIESLLNKLVSTGVESQFGPRILLKAFLRFSGETKMEIQFERNSLVVLQVESGQIGILFPRRAADEAVGNVHRHDVFRLFCL